ncbi:MAG: hypothetical protein RIR33_657 [Pseudomonadota bacterium]|jgi:acyl carrier protein
MDEVERKVTAILASLLVVEGVSLEDDFFMLGGDSLAATVLMSAIEANYGILVDPVEIFECPNVGKFCARVRQLREEAAA